MTVAEIELKIKADRAYHAHVSEYVIGSDRLTRLYHCELLIMLDEIALQMALLHRALGSGLMNQPSEDKGQ